MLANRVTSHAVAIMATAKVELQASTFQIRGCGRMGEAYTGRARARHAALPHSGQGEEADRPERL